MDNKDMNLAWKQYKESRNTVEKELQLRIDHVMKGYTTPAIVKVYVLENSVVVTFKDLGSVCESMISQICKELPGWKQFHFGTHYRFKHDFVIEAFGSW